MCWRLTGADQSVDALEDLETIKPDSLTGTSWIAESYWFAHQQSRDGGHTSSICGQARRPGDVAPNILLWGVGTSRMNRPHWALHA